MLVVDAAQLELPFERLADLRFGQVGEGVRDRLGAVVVLAVGSVWAGTEGCAATVARAAGEVRIGATLEAHQGVPQAVAVRAAVEADGVVDLTVLGVARQLHRPLPSPAHPPSFLPL